MPPGASLERAKKLPKLEIRLEEAFKDCRELWWRLGREMGAAPTAQFAQTPTAAAFGSDFGLMLAWSRLAEEMAAGEDVCLAVCSDPWLFRHLAGLPGVKAGRSPRLWTRALLLRLRGLLARGKTALKAALASWRLKSLKKAHAQGGYVLLVYGHPRSDAKGYDDYFGSLMKDMPRLKRLLHTDCAAARALELSADGRTASLHAWGNPFFALSLPFTAWRPGRVHTHGSHAWLVRRAAARENGGGGPAMNRWQHHCQKRWLARVRPSRVAWPWENHGWERAFCRAARKQGVPTLGYQHTVIGPFQINYSTAANWDGLDSIPDLVVSNGPAYLDELEAWGVPLKRLVIGGALRFKPFEKSLYDGQGPVFVPLSAIPQAAKAQVKAARALAATGRKTLVKEHPMYPLDFEEIPNLTRTKTPLQEQSGLSAVLYSTGTSGLEALLA
ncbi:MAG TPA: hypothetical protein ENI79_05805, partial [Rhodospirillales bacterium]|nr:hypothetical protein [Rhodospirillales bacterium]